MIWWYFKQKLLIYSGQDQVVDVLIRHNANVNIQDLSKQTPLHIASKLGNHSSSSSLFSPIIFATNKIRS